MDQAVFVSSLSKEYEGKIVVSDVSFGVAEGEVFGLVGPNGAGKTTILECIEGLRKPTTGRVLTLGLDPWKHRKALMERIGIQLQECSLPRRLKVGEAVNLFSSLYDRRWPPDIHNLMQLMDLDQLKNQRIDKLSGGEKQKLYIALALVHDPRLILLDELTTGLDPHARRAMWDLIKTLQSEQRCIILTTHFMEEAEFLCDRVGIVDGGKLLALDSPKGLIERFVGNQKALVTGSIDSLSHQIQLFDNAFTHTAGKERLEVFSPRQEVLDPKIVKLLKSRNGNGSVQVQPSSLEDVFLRLTAKTTNQRPRR